jgi:predicted transcriptional regulator
VPVVDKGQVVGMITDRDVCMAAYIAGAPLNTLRISRVMSTTVRSCKAGEPLASAERMMRLHKVRRLPVIDAAGRLVGILSLNDLAREAAREHVPETKDVSPEALTETLAAICELRRPQEIAAA